MKTTRRIYFGWKHGATDRMYTLVSGSKGGGSQRRDVSKGGGSQRRDVEWELDLSGLLDLMKGKK